ncbi:LPS-assembly protein LptD [Hydrogenophaga electricum]|uniref:LPS-assembly protein LptD n=2 Tax=Hydrogenophaga electricum TaxID=1230953 RepID=A0ABQ6CDI6_9BURK|nr:LPS-assembly protein LptD [Hydrogenophaga electricum]
MQGVMACLAIGTLPAAWAQTAAEESPLPLRVGTSLLEQLPQDVRKQTPTFVFGEQIEGKTDGVTVIEGEAELRRHDAVIRGDRIEYDNASGETKAQGRVLVNKQGDRFQGPELQYNTNTEKGHFQEPTYELLRNDARGDASRVEFLGDGKAEVYNGRYSTCPRPPGATWNPDWLLRAERIELDNVEEVGAAHSGVLEFKGVPFLAMPYLTFPLSDKRKSGVLPPSVSVDSVSGFSVTAPYYLNLAPNYDLTLEPTYMAKRGVDLTGEFRYLQPNYLGQVRASYMPSDSLRDMDRWAYSWQHSQNVGQITGSDSLRVGVNLNRVGDDNYWSDFPRALRSLTSRLLRNDAVAVWRQGPWVANVGAYTYQTLQLDDSPITPPYDQLPSTTLTYSQQDRSLLGMPGWDFTVQTNVTRFRRANFVPTEGIQGNGERAFVMAEATRRWEAPGWYVQPKLRVHSAQYRMDDVLLGSSRSASRTLPTLSVDSGMVFERQAAYFGRNYLQTLEPRLFATWTPYRDQSYLPNFDSASRSFNWAAMFTENAFGGNDRISDTRALTLGLSSRLIDPESGAEIVRLGWAQRALLKDQLVTLPGGSAVTERLSDMLLTARVQWDPLWALDSTVQYNPKSRESARSTIGVRYTPGPYKVFSAAYRVQRERSKQLDIGWQWPLSELWGEAGKPVPNGALGPGQWYAVGRLNYSVMERKPVDVVAGFEYDAGCWVGRVVLERLQLNTTSANQRVLFQLEFSGFSRLGGSSLEALKSHIPKYQYLRQETLPASRFEQYD